MKYRIELPDRSYSVLDIQEYFQYILKKHGQNINDNNNPSIKICINKIETGTAFKIKTGYYIELLTPKTVKLLGSTKSKVTKDGNGGNVPHLKITEVVLVHCNIVNNNYHQNSRVLYTFIPNKLFGHLLHI